jgi:hypothetical protein
METLSDVTSEELQNPVIHLYAFLTVTYVTIQPYPQSSLSASPPS